MWKEKQHSKECCKLLAVTLLQILELLKLLRISLELVRSFKRGGKLLIVWLFGCLVVWLFGCLVGWLVVSSWLVGWCNV